MQSDKAEHFRLVRLYFLKEIGVPLLEEEIRIKSKGSAEKGSRRRGKGNGGLLQCGCLLASAELWRSRSLDGCELGSYLELRRAVADCIRAAVNINVTT